MQVSALFSGRMRTITLNKKGLVCLLIHISLIRTLLDLFQPSMEVCQKKQKVRQTYHKITGETNIPVGILLVHDKIDCPLSCAFKKNFPRFNCNSFRLHRVYSIRSKFLGYKWYWDWKTLTSSGNQTPGCVFPSRTASANAAVALPTDLEDKSPKTLQSLYENYTKAVESKDLHRKSSVTEYTNCVASIWAFQINLFPRRFGSSELYFSTWYRK